LKRGDATRLKALDDENARRKRLVPEQALGLTIPPHVLLQATEVIQ